MDEKKLVRFDWALQSLLREKKNYTILQGFLCAVLEKEVQILHILESPGPGPEPLSCNGMTLLALSDEGEQVFIELILDYSDLPVRFFNTSRKVLWGVERVIVIRLSFFTSREEGSLWKKAGFIQREKVLEGDVLWSCFQKSSHEESFPAEYYLISVEQYQGSLLSELDQWLYFLKYERVPGGCFSLSLQKVRERLCYLDLSHKEKSRYHRFLENLIYVKDRNRSFLMDGFGSGFDDEFE